MTDEPASSRPGSESATDVDLDASAAQAAWDALAQRAVAHASDASTDPNAATTAESAQSSEPRDARLATLPAPSAVDTLRDDGEGGDVTVPSGFAFRSESTNASASVYDSADPSASNDPQAGAPAPTANAMNALRPSLVIVPVLLLAVVTGALIWYANQPAGDLQAQPRVVTQEEVDAVLTRMEDSTSAEELWLITPELTDMGASALPHLRAAVGRAGDDQLKPTTRVAAYKAMYSLAAEKEALNLIIDFVKTETDIESSVMAANLLVTLGSLAIDPSIEPKLLDLLEAVFEPDVKIQICRALWHVCKNTTSKRELRLLMRSDMIQTRAAAALALAELGDFDTTEDILKSLRYEPSARGRLAAELLVKKRLLYQLQQAMLGSPNLPDRDEDGRTESDSLDEYLNRPLPDPSTVTIKTDIIDEVMRWVSQVFIYPDQIRDDRLFKAAIDGMLQDLDPYSAYVTLDESESFDGYLDLAYPGVGIVVGKHNGLFTVIATIDDSPAERAGIRAGDRLFTINDIGIAPDAKTNLLPPSPLTIVDVIGALRGTDGSRVDIELQRAGWYEPRTFHLTREQIAPPTIVWDVFADGTGYIRVPYFHRNMLETFTAALDDLHERGVTGIVLDLRGNPGGEITAALAVADAFLKDGLSMCYLEGRNELLAPRKTFTSEDGKHDDSPLVVVTDLGTCEAGELVAGILKHHGRARVVGTTTWGKASVQRLIPIQADDNSAALKLTIAHYFLPDGSHIQDVGVPPHIIAYAAPQPAWVMDEYEREGFHSAVEAWFAEQWAKDPDALRALADFDARDPKRWPALDELMKASNTHADAIHVRHYLHERVRAAAIAEGRVGASVDMLDDYPLYCAAWEIARLNGLDPKTQPAIARVFNVLDEDIREPNAAE